MFPWPRFAFGLAAKGLYAIAREGASLQIVAGLEARGWDRRFRPRAVGLLGRAGAGFVERREARPGGRTIGGPALTGNLRSDLQTQRRKLASSVFDPGHDRLVGLRVAGESEIDIGLAVSCKNYPFPR